MPRSTSTRRLHLCPTCQKSFSTSGHLQRHTRVHTGEKKHKCPFPGCQTRCSRQDNLQQHYRIHLSPGSRRSGNSLLNQSRISAQSRKTVASSSSATTVPQPTPPVIEVPFTIIDGPPVIQIPPATPSDQSLSPPNTPPPLVPADPQVVLQHIQRQHSTHGSPLTNPDMNINIPTWQTADPGFPVRPLSSSSFSSTDSPGELINTPGNFPNELCGFSNQIVAIDEQPGGVHSSWLPSDSSFGTFPHDFSKEMSPTSSTGFVDFHEVYEAPSNMPSNFYSTSLSTSAPFSPQHSQEPETPAQLYMRTFKSHASSPHGGFAGYPDCYVNQLHTRSNSLPNMPFPENPPHGMTAGWGHVRNDFTAMDWSCATQYRSWA